jgi:hypothetical protein
LGDHGKNLWLQIISEYDVSDAGGRELLLLACQSLDRAVEEEAARQEASKKVYERSLRR